MSYSDYLAKRYMQVKQLEDAVSGSAELDDLKAKRHAFESSMREEEVLRNYVDRMNSLAEERAKDNPQGLGAAADIVAERMAPIPHSLGEAAVRLPLVGAGAGLGHAWGAERSSVGAEDLSRLFTNPDKKIEMQLVKHIKDQAKNPRAVTGLMRALHKTNPEVAASVLRDMPYTKAAPEATALKSTIQKAFGNDKGVSSLRRALSATLSAAPGAETGMLGKLFKNKYTAIPALLGGAAASVGTGLALSIPDLIAQARGGRGAVNARNTADEAKQKAEELSKLREQLLRKLETKQLPAKG